MILSNDWARPGCDAGRSTEYILYQCIEWAWKVSIGRTSERESIRQTTTVTAWTNKCQKYLVWSRWIQLRNWSWASSSL